jgi:hypothetical protein
MIQAQFRKGEPLTALPRYREHKSVCEARASATKDWRWDLIVKGVDAEPVEQAQDSDTWEKRIFLGSYTLSPSGKVYAVFAVGNLALCPACRGKGHHRPRNLYQRLALAEWRRVPWKPGETFREGAERKARTKALMDKGFHSSQDAEGYLHCRRCEGGGRHEPVLDSVWHMAMEAEAKKHGLYFYAQDNDYFVSRIVDAPASEE